MVQAGPQLYEPDIVYYDQQQYAGFGEGLMLLPVPRLVVEILSKSTARRDRGQKFEDYAAYGVQEYLIVDPIAKTIEQFINKDSVFELAVKLGVGERYLSEVIACFECEVGVVFG